MLNLILREMGGMPARSSESDKLFDVIDRTLTPFYTWSPRPAPTWPVFEVSHTEDAVVVTADVPGLADEDLAITVADRTLTIEGKTTRRGYERAFQRDFALADGLDLDRIQAQLERGVLTIVVPKTPKAQPRRIQLGTTTEAKVLASEQPKDAA